MRRSDSILFVALFVVIIVAILIARSRFEAAVIVGAALAIAGLWRRNAAKTEDADRLAEEGFDARLTGKSGFCPLPGARPPDLVGLEPEDAIPPAGYPGDPDNEAGLWGSPMPEEQSEPVEPVSEGFTGDSIDYGNSSRATGPNNLAADGSAFWTGADVGAQAEEYADRAEGDDAMAPEGNPYSLGRLDAPMAAAPCVDDEANDSEYDIDEKNVYQARSRNDETRVAAGTMRRRREMDKYFREELDIAQDREWWGRHEW